MIFVQLTGLSGSGKSTLAKKLKRELLTYGYKVEIIDGDEYRKTLCSDLGFSKADRTTNIERLSFVGKILVRNDIIAILAAINPYEKQRKKICKENPDCLTIWLKCPVSKLKERDTKGLYQKALLPDEHPNKIFNLSGVNDPYEEPKSADLIINTDSEPIDASAHRITELIKLRISRNIR